MAKEIEEQPITLKNGIKEYIDTVIMISIFTTFHGKKMKFLQLH